MTLPLPYDPYEVTTEHGDHVGLTYRSLDEIHEINLARDSTAGAICSFIGTTRDSFQDKTVTELEYEAYPSMAVKTMQAIVNEARSLSSQGSFSFEWPSYPLPRENTGVSRRRRCCQGQDPTSSAAPGAGPSALELPAAHLVPQVHSSSSAVKDLTRICLVHRLGIVPPKESSIAIVVSSPHRREAFRACEWILEEVKKRVEIWKREVYAPDNAHVDGNSSSDAGMHNVQKAWKENLSSCT